MKAIQVTPYGLCSIFLSRNFTFQCLRVFCRKIACKTHPIVRHKLSCRAEVECKFQIMLMNTSGTDATCHHHKLWNNHLPNLKSYWCHIQTWQVETLAQGQTMGVSTSAKAAFTAMASIRKVTWEIGSDSNFSHVEWYRSILYSSW